MSSRGNRSGYKDRIVENVAKAIKGIQEIQIYHTTDEPIVLSCHDRPARKLLEHLDHVFLHGLRHVTNGYWRIVSEFTTKDVVREIKRLRNVATDLGRGRAWLSLSLNEGLMESYFRCFDTNMKLVKKHYVTDALVLDQQRLNVLITLISGIELVVFQLDYDVPYLDLGTAPPYIRSRADSVESESDRLSICSMESIVSNASKNMVVSHEAPVIADDQKMVNGYLGQIDENTETKFDRLDSVINEDVEPEDTSIEVIHVKRGSGKTKKAKPKKGKKEPKVIPLDDRDILNNKNETVHFPDADVTEHHEQYQQIENLEKDVKPFYKLTLGVKEEELMSSTDETLRSKCNISETKTIVTNTSPDVTETDNVYNESFDISEEKSSSDGEFIEDEYVPGYIPDKHCDIDTEFSEKVIKEFQNRNKMSLSKSDDMSKNDLTFSNVVDRGSGDSEIIQNDDNTQNSAIIHVNKQNEIRLDDSQLNSEQTFDISNPPHNNEYNKLTNKEAVDSTNEKSSTSKMQDLVDNLINKDNGLLKSHMYEEEPEDVKLEDSLTKSQETCEGEIKLDNNTLLYLMLDVFDTSDEQFIKVFATTQGHTDGDCTTVFLTITDRSIYFLSQKQSDHRFYKDVSVPFYTVDYISVGVNSQILHIVCTKRRNQYWITTGNQALTNSIIDCMTATCHDSEVKLTILTDATTQKIALKKYISKECPNDEIPTMCCYTLVHWDTPSSKGDKSQTLHREGHMLYKLHEPPGGFIGSQLLQNPVSLIYGQSWKPAYVALRDGLLCIYNDKNDSKPLFFVQVGGEECTGCRRATDTDRDHCIQIIKSDGSAIQLALASGLEASEWLQGLCQAVAEGIDTKKTDNMGCMSCCLVLSPHKLLMCHEDLQSSFFRTLGSANVIDITSVSDDPVVKTYCVLAFEPHDTNISSDHWVLHFNSEHEKLKFIDALSKCWKEHFQVEVPVLPVEDFSLMKTCQEVSFLLRDKLTVKKS